MRAQSILLFSMWFPIAASLSACAAQPLQCPAGMNAMKSELLYFGTARPNGTVSPQQWQDFLAQSVTPEFPGGFTAWRAAGQWQSGAGEIAREDSYVLNIVHAGGEQEQQAFERISADYTTRFEQEAGLRVRSEVCAQF